MIRITTIWHNPNPNTIWNKLAQQLGREPTNDEARHEVERILKSDGGGESRPATGKEGVSYSKAQANQLPTKSSYRPSGEVAPAGPRAESRIETAGVAPGPSESEKRAWMAREYRHAGESFE